MGDISDYDVKSRDGCLKAVPCASDAVCHAHICGARKAQSAMELLTTYGSALIIIAIITIFFFLYFSGAQAVTPNSCTMTYGANCNDFIVGKSNSITAVLMFFSSTLNYPVANPVLYANVSGTQFKGLCEPSYILPGGAIICNATMPGSISQMTSYSGSLELVDSLCANGNALTCTTPVQHYSGTFSGHPTSITANEPTVLLSLSQATLPRVNNSIITKIMVNAKLKGYNIPGATIPITTNSPVTILNPTIGTTDANGNSTYYMISNHGLSGNVLVTATFTSATSNIVVQFSSTITASSSTSSTSSTTSSTSSTSSSTTSSILYNYIYCVNQNGNIYPYYASVSGSSGFGTWTAGSTAYPSIGTNTVESCATYGDYIYCVDSTGEYPYYASVSSSGFGTWTAGPIFPKASNPAVTCAITGGYIYCVVEGPTPSTYYASVSSSGFGAWTASAATSPLTYGSGCATYTYHTTLCANEKYCVDIECDKSGSPEGYATVYSGTGYEFTTWSSGSNYPGLSSSSCTMQPYPGNYIYCVHPKQSSYYAPVSTSGTGTWTAGTAFPNIGGSLLCATS